MNPQEVIQYISRFVPDASQARYSTTQKTIKNPSATAKDRAMGKDEITVTVETWKMPNSEEVIFEGYRTPGDAGYVALTQATPKSPNTSASANESVSAPPTQPNLVSRNPDGSLKVDPNPNYAQAQNTPAGERAAQQNVERKRNSEAIGIPFDDIERREWEDAKAKEARAVTVQEKDLALRERVALENSAQTRWAQGIKERELAGSEAERVRAAERQARLDTEAANKPTMIEGKPHRAVKNEQGEVTGYELIPVGGDKPYPEIERLKTDYAGIPEEMDRRRSAINELWKTGEINRDDRDRMLTEEYNSGIRQKQHIESILSQQGVIQNQQITQRGQDINASQINTGFAQNALERAGKAHLEPYAGLPGSGQKSVKAFSSLFNLQKELAQGIPGALASPATIQPTAAQQDTLNIRLNNGTQISLGGQGGGAGGATPAPVAAPDLGNLGSYLGGGMPGAGVGPQGENLTRPGFSEGMPDPMQHLQPILQQYDDGDDPEWTAALGQVAQESFA